ncbi:MAG: FAD-dependent oxidoreductase [Phycisphaerae bacterium]|nr:FAD-dependent oxidoreductase [Phycisphaerae bacterium]
MPEQDATARCRNVGEVALGYTEEQARLEAMRCLQCRNAPCVEGCPVRIRIRDFTGAIAEGDYRQALAIIKENSLLPAVCGRVCPQEVQCQEKCTVGLSLKDVSKAVSIGRLERFVADWRDERVPPSRVAGILPASRGQDALDTKEQGRNALSPSHLPTFSPSSTPTVAPPTGMKVAIIGSGPGGIVAAADTRRAGHEVTVFEAFHKPGGVMVYGIPEFRLPKAIVQQEIETLRKMGVKIVTNFIVGRTRTIEQLMKEDGFDAVYIGVGAGLPSFMNIEGESLVGVYSANEYLTRANLMKAYQFGSGADTPIARSKRVAVVGGGNVAMDSARTAVRLGAEKVYLIYRRTEKEMPARVEEVHHAKQEGVDFHLLQNPKRILGDASGSVVALECLRYELGEPDASGRRRPVAIPGSEFQIDVDTVIIAIGNQANPLIRQTTPGLGFNKWGNLIVDENCKTSMEGVYAGGDIVLGAATVILAMGQGRIAAAAMNEYLAKKRECRKS